MKQGIITLSIALTLFCGCKGHKDITKVPIKDAPKPLITSTVPAKPLQNIDLPVFIPVAELQKQIYQVLFAPGYGKYYPCSSQPNCDKRFKDLYLENPMISITGNLISIKMHLAGVAHILFLSPGISADLTLTAIPEVKNDTLYFRKISMEQSSGNLLLNLTSAIFKKTIEQKIQQNASYSFRPALDSITRQVKKQFPVKWGGIALLLNLNKIYLKKVSIESSPDQGILADFSADLEEEDSSFAR